MSKRDYSFNIKHLINYGLKIDKIDNDKIISFVMYILYTFWS